MSKPVYEPLDQYREYPPSEMKQRAKEFFEEMRRRRSVRDFSDRPVPREVIEDCIRTAATAPSGANMQPWHFSVIEDPKLKRRIRVEAEKVEREFYGGKASDEWLQALAPLGTDEHKPFLELAPYLVVIFAQLHGVDSDGQPTKHYYVNESVGIATGFLLAAVHHAGLASLTHTPSPMRFLNRLLERPPHERPYLIVAVGYPAADARVPEIRKKSLAEVSEFA